MTESRKPNVLLVGESSYLSSGYSTYGYEVLKRLHATGMFNLTELGSFGSYDHPAALELLRRSPRRHRQQARLVPGRDADRPGSRPGRNPGQCR